MMKRLPTTLALSALPALFLWVLVIVPLWSMLGYGEQPLWREIFTDAYYQHRLLWTVVQATCTVVLTWLLVYGGCKDLAQAKAELKQARPQMVLSPATAKAVEAAANRLKQG